MTASASASASRDRAPLRVAVAQTLARPGDVAYNAAEAAVTIARAADAGARVVLFPELSLTGYEPGWLKSALPAGALTPDGPELSVVREACRATGVTAVVGAPTPAGEKSAISAIAVGGDGEVLADYRKSRLEEHERELFTPGTDCRTLTVDGWQLALGICYDSSFPEHARAAARSGADAYLCGGAFVQGDSDHRRSVYFPARALENTFYVLFANFAGRQGPWDFCGRSAVYGPDGRVLATAGGEEAELVLADLDDARLAETRRALTMLRDVDRFASPPRTTSCAV
ncbi:carbon-nitrogen hydrolase family protein [Streptomyces sp. NBC_00249]|uniref:carbon-nitrogen hydrolase family protein n=1 Tax=Streptomyces sp. NBC_00249 TaxID=2975690 RepID=UPI00224DED14|nr:carbon-nitrogen hydrolase family protein [Streptomyces sp. NBC_00249]MCX5193510.1 carbon-nitrogen hydrolase family protein [Streptomyces sp. NBC_00249]